MTNRIWKLVLLVACAGGCHEPRRGETRAVAKDGPMVLEDRVEMSKGSAFVGGYMLPHEDLRARFGNDWSKVLDHKRVRVRGVTEIYVCELNAQCLVGGTIPRFLSVTSMEIAEP